jgi:hypothetical protein
VLSVKSVVEMSEAKVIQGSGFFVRFSYAECMTASSNRAKAFTRVELILVIVLIAALAFVFVLPRFARAHQGSGPSCVNNLKQLGIAYRIWATDHGGKFPSEVS